MDMVRLLSNCSGRGSRHEYVFDYSMGVPLHLPGAIGMGVMAGGAQGKISGECHVGTTGQGRECQERLWVLRSFLHFDRG